MVKLLFTSLNKLEKDGAISLLTLAHFWLFTKKGTRSLYVVFLKAVELVRQQTLEV